MSEEEAEGAPAQNPTAHFSGNVMNFERPKFNARQENRILLKILLLISLEML